MTVFGRVNHLDAEPGTQARLLSPTSEPALCAGWDEYLATAGEVKAYHMTHQPVHVVSQHSLNAWLVASERRSAPTYGKRYSALETFP